MENSWIIVKPPALVAWQPKIDLMVASRPQHTDCYILAENDVEAIKVWIQQFKETPTTKRAYQKEAERLLLWCTFEKGMTLADLKAEYFEEYFNFLQNGVLRSCPNIDIYPQLCPMILGINNFKVVYRPRKLKKQHMVLICLLH